MCKTQLISKSEGWGVSIATTKMLNYFFPPKCFLSASLMFVFPICCVGISEVEGFRDGRDAACEGCAWQHLCTRAQASVSMPVAAPLGPDGPRPSFPLNSQTVLSTFHAEDAAHMSLFYSTQSCYPVIPKIFDLSTRLRLTKNVDRGKRAGQCDLGLFLIVFLNQRGPELNLIYLPFRKKKKKTRWPMETHFLRQTI